MDTEEMVQPDAEEQDTDTGVDSETNDSSTDSTTDDRYENQKRRAEKAETEAKVLKAKLAELSGTKEPEKEAKTVNNSDSERLDRMELRQEGYAPEVIDEIMKLGGVKALSNPLIRSAATEMQAKHKAEQAADISDGPQSQSRTKYSAEDLAKMSVEEMEKVLPHAE